MNIRPHDVPADHTEEDLHFVLQHKTLAATFRKKVVFYDAVYVAHALTIKGKRRPTIYVKKEQHRDLLCKVRGGWEDVTEAFFEDYILEVDDSEAIRPAAALSEKAEAKADASERRALDDLADLAVRAPAEPEKRKPGRPPKNKEV